MYDRLNLFRDATETIYYGYLHIYHYKSDENNDHCTFEIGSQIVILRWWWSGKLLVKNAEMEVKSVCAEGEILEKCFLS